LTQSGAIIAVVIGRNEGQGIQASLRSVQAARLPVVYADSGSTDGSPDRAKELGVPVVELESERPFSAGRGRNEGLDEALRRWPNATYVLFLDGDCVLEPRFPLAAATRFRQNGDCAIVTGHLAERNPSASIYNRLCAIEWRSPAGPIENMNGLGGIMVARISAFQKVGGFDLDAIAGEEPDLGVRLRLAGYSILKINEPMATHDADIMKFGQWWMRAVRGGHALAHRYARHGRTSLRDGRRELMSTLFWGLGWPSVVFILLLPTRGCSLLFLLGYALLGWRVYRHYFREGLRREDARLVTRFILYGKFAEAVGVLRYCINRIRGKFQIIEYKQDRIRRRSPRR
jgi:GT2 family glycosyltransferase